MKTKNITNPDGTAVVDKLLINWLMNYMCFITSEESMMSPL